MKLYSQLIVAAKRANRKKLKPEQSGYVYLENHHIWPVAFGIDNQAQNQVLLTFPEHVEAHVLLAKLYQKAHKIQSVAARMLTDKKGEPASVEVAEYARALAGSATGKRNSQLHAEGKHPSQKPENRRAASERWEGDKHPQKSQKNRKAKSELWKSDSNPARKPENREATSKRTAELNRKLNGEQVTCAYCLKTGGRAGMQKWHFDNCLQHPGNSGLTRLQIKTSKLTVNK